MATALQSTTLFISQQSKTQPATTGTMPNCLSTHHKETRS